MSNAQHRTDKIWAKCPICGGGADVPASSLTNADSQSNITTERIGEYLVWFEGELMCCTCKQNRINRQQSEVSAERHAQEDDFRAAAGFRRSIS